MRVGLVNTVRTRPLVKAVKTASASESKSDYQTPADTDWVDAGRLMREHSIDPEQKPMMRENLATYLAHRTNGFPGERWQNKIERELKSPYSDEQVYQQLERLEDSLQANLAEMPVYPSKLYLTGSFAKGRLGANSDLDGYAVIPDEHMTSGFDSFVKREKAGSASNLFPLGEGSPGYARGHLLFAGQSLEIDPAKVSEDGFLTEAYNDILSGRGIDRQETTRSFEWITSKLWGEEKTAEEKRDAFQSKSFKTRVQNGIMSLGGTLSTTPLVGPAIMWVCDKFATQKHLKVS